MENIHSAIAWYQKKIGSYDKQLWEQSVEKKLQKGLPNAHHAPRKTVRLKTEYIDVDLIRGSTFTKTKPQVPWIYITKKAIVRVLFFPFYYRWWVLQSSRKVFYVLFTLYLLQVITAFIFFLNLDGSIIEDELQRVQFSSLKELTLTEVVVPISLMFLLGLIHSQTVLAHFSLKPPRRDGRHGSKKKRQRHGSSLSKENSSEIGTSSQQLNHDTVEERNKKEMSPGKTYRHTASLWNVPRVEVSGVEANSSKPLPSSLRQASSLSRCSRSSKRTEKKIVRIFEVSQKCPSPLPESSKKVETKMDDIHLGSSNDVEIVLSSTSVRCAVDTLPHVDSTVHMEYSSQKNVDNTDDEKVSVVIHEVVNVMDDSFEQVVQKGSKCSEADRSSSGIDDGCDSSAAWESETCPCPADTTDSDSLVGRFELVHLDRGFRRSQSSDDFASALQTNKKEDQSDNENLPCDISEQISEVRTSFSEDCTTDQRDEDNLSDTGHVSNSSNYNPSDSGSDVENCDGDLVDMPIPKNQIINSSNMENDASVIRSSSPHLSTTTLTASPRKVAQQSQQMEGESSASEPGSPDARQSMSGVRRRRRGGSEQCDGNRPRPLPPKLLGLRAQSKITQTSGVSSSENETDGLTPEASNKASVSSEEWEDRMQSDVTTSSSYSTSNSESELSENVENVDEELSYDDLVQECLPVGAFHGISFMQPPNSGNPSNHGAQPDKVSCVIWEGNECKKLDLTALDIGWAIIDKVDNLPESSDYIFIGVILSFCLGCVPFVYRFYSAKAMSTELSSQVLNSLWAVFMKNSWGQNLITLNGFIQRLALSCIFFFLLTVTDRTFKQRLLYAKHFSYLTSSRRARKFDMPHFRLNKVRNIKIWLSLRSYLKRRGPQRSVDVIVSASFYLTISLVFLMCIQMLKDSETYLDYLCNWELIVWCLALGIYIMRFMTLGLKINKKYRNLSVLITEQINLYLQMEQKPHKKEELTLANNVLRLAEDLLKELESPFKISGFSANPLIYNITKVVVLSAFSAVMTEVLGFKLKLYKIKLK